MGAFQIEGTPFCFRLKICILSDALRPCFFPVQGAVHVRFDKESSYVPHRRFLRAALRTRPALSGVSVFWWGPSFLGGGGSSNRVLFIYFIYLLFIFYCCSITVVCIFSPPLHPTPAKPTSLPCLRPLLWFCPCPL